MFIYSHFQKLYVLKSSDVEEPVDLFWHRPLAAALTATLLSMRLKVTPNRLTYSSLLAGWLGSLILYLTAFSPSTLASLWPADSPYGWMVASLLYMLSVILDCADGQLARYLGGGTRMGRILDGIVDALVALPLWVIMGVWLYQTYGSSAFWYTFVVGWNQWLQIAIYDRIKTVYLARTKPSSADGNEERDQLDEDYRLVMSEGPIIEKLMMFMYYRMLKVQDMVTSEGNESVSKAANIDFFRRDMKGWMRLSSFLGLGTHMFLVYIAVGLTGIYPYAFLVVETIFLTLFNIILVLGVIGSKRMASEKYN